MTSTSGVTGVILAAGFSRRLGRPKQLLVVDGKPLLQIAIDAAIAADLDEVIVVLGEAAPAIAERIQLGRCHMHINEHAVEGQSSSIVSAMKVANLDRIGTLFMLGDQPDLTSEDLNRIIDGFDGDAESITIASWHGTQRSPVIFGRAYDRELMSLNGDTGARPLVIAHRDRVQTVLFDRPVPADIDTENDYQTLLAERKRAGQ